MNNTNDEFILTACTYIVGLDIKPGRYSLKLVKGNLGLVQINGKERFFQWLGTESSNPDFYKNIRLIKDSKIEISGDIEVMLIRQNSFNIEEDASIIEQQREEIEKLKMEMSELRKELLDIKIQDNESYLPDEYILSKGFYYGGETIKTGIYNIEVISGVGYLIHKGNYNNMGDRKYATMKLIGLKISPKSKIEITDQLVVKAVKMNKNQL